MCLSWCSVSSQPNLSRLHDLGCGRHFSESEICFFFHFDTLHVLYTQYFLLVCYPLFQFPDNWLILTWNLVDICNVMVDLYYNHYNTSISAAMIDMNACILWNIPDFHHTKVVLFQGDNLASGSLSNSTTLTGKYCARCTIGIKHEECSWENCQLREHDFYAWHNSAYFIAFQTSFYSHLSSSKLQNVSDVLLKIKPKMQMYTSQIDHMELLHASWHK